MELNTDQIADIGGMLFDLEELKVPELAHRYLQTARTRLAPAAAAATSSSSPRFPRKTAAAIGATGLLGGGAYLANRAVQKPAEYCYMCNLANF